jgi:hypothetical protein
MEVVVWGVGIIVTALTGFWLIMAIPLAYSLWRYIAVLRVCATCGSRELIPTDSPIGRQIVETTKKPDATLGS